MDALQTKLQAIVEGKIDFEGQKQVEQVVHVTIVAATIMSFVIGFALQSLRVTFAIFGMSTVLLILFVVPPWPIFNRNPVQWLPAKASEKGVKPN